MNPTDRSAETAVVEQLRVTAQRRLAAREVALIDLRLDARWDDLLDEITVELSGYILRTETVVEERTVDIPYSTEIDPVVGPATWVDHFRRDVARPAWDRLTRNPSTPVGRWIRLRTKPRVWNAVIRGRIHVEGLASTTVPVRYDRRVCPHGTIAPPRKHAPFLVHGLRFDWVYGEPVPGGIPNPDFEDGPNPYLNEHDPDRP